jgi:hypothetical protein
MNEKQIQAELNKLEGGLFLDKEVDSYGRVYYCIKHFPKGAIYPFKAVDWRDPEGNPKPLSADLLSQLYSQEGSIAEAAKQAIVENAVKKELEKKNLAQMAEEIAHEHQFENRKGKIIPIAPRGAGPKPA